MFTLSIYFMCSSTLVLFVSSITAVLLCIALQGALGFSPAEKIASGREKNVVRMMVAHGSNYLCIELC
jgi:hypothetical protein